MRLFNTIAVLVLSLIAIMQGLRFALAWPLSVNGFEVPLWASAVACIVLALLALMLWREARH